MCPVGIYSYIKSTETSKPSSKIIIQKIVIFTTFWDTINGVWIKSVKIIPACLFYIIMSTSVEMFKFTVPTL